MQARQVERETIARDLHDTFLQSVQGLILHFHAGTRQLPEGNPVRKRFEKALDRSDDVLTEGRRILLRLTSEKVSSQTLAEGLAEVGQSLRTLAPAEFDVQVRGQERAINQAVREELFQLGREAIFNAFRHSQAKKIEAVVDFGDSELRLQVIDHGIGIGPGILQSGGIPGHLGLQGMRERARIAGGSVEIRSQQGVGSTIDVRIPGEIAYRTESANWIPNWIRRLWTA